MTTDKTTTERSIREAWDALDAATTAAFAAATAPSFTAEMIAQAVNPARRALDAAIRADERERLLDEIAALKTEADPARAEIAEKRDAATNACADCLAEVARLSAALADERDAREQAACERDEARGGPYRHECAQCKREMWSVQDAGKVWCGVCTFAMVDQDRDEARRDLDAARELLREAPGRHDHGCSADCGTAYPCKCGLDDWHARVTALLGREGDMNIEKRLADMNASESSEDLVRRLASQGPLMSGNWDVRNHVLTALNNRVHDQSAQYDAIAALRAEVARLDTEVEEKAAGNRKRRETIEQLRADLDAARGLVDVNYLGRVVALARAEPDLPTESVIFQAAARVATLLGGT